MHAKSGGPSGEPPDFLFMPTACRSRKDLPRSAGGAKSGRGTRATVRGTRETGRRRRDAGDGRRGHGTRETGQETGARARGAGRRTRATGRGQQNTGNAGTGRRRQGTSPRAWTAARLHNPPAPQQPAGAVHSQTPPPPDTQSARAIHCQAPPPGPATIRRGRSQPAPSATGAPYPTCRAYESESRRCRRARRTCCCRAAPRPT